MIFDPIVRLDLSNVGSEWSDSAIDLSEQCVASLFGRDPITKPEDLAAVTNSTATQSIRPLRSVYLLRWLLQPLANGELCVAASARGDVSPKLETAHAKPNRDRYQIRPFDKVRSCVSCCSHSHMRAMSDGALQFIDYSHDSLSEPPDRRFSHDRSQLAAVHL